MNVCAYTTNSFASDKRLPRMEMSIDSASHLQRNRFRAFRDCSAFVDRHLALRCPERGCKRRGVGEGIGFRSGEPAECRRRLAGVYRAEVDAMVRADATNATFGRRRCDAPSSGSTSEALGAWVGRYQ